MRRVPSLLASAFALLFTTPLHAQEPSQAPIEVVVRTQRSEAQRLQRSAEAVNVVDLSKARQQTVDLGEVLARTQGVAVRRDGGLGSSARFSLNGLYDDQIRFFLDGVPLEVTGYPFGIVNVPVNLVERVEVYRGVVPIRFGADALGGAVNLVSDQRYESHARSSYQVGSFGLHRATVDGRYRHEPTGIVVGGNAFFDIAENDYDIAVDAPDANSVPQPVTVRRFHDGYLGYGATLEAGVIEKPWAKRLLLRGFVSGYDKEIQHNVVMTVPYGDAHNGEQVYGTIAHYEVDLTPELSLELLAGYARRTIDFVDDGRWIYDWFGRRIAPRAKPGEFDLSDQTIWQDNVFARALAGFTIAPGHVLRASTTPLFSTRTGTERIRADPNARDPLRAREQLLTIVSGVEYELTLWNDDLQNIVFVKDYHYDARYEDSALGRELGTTRHAGGAGDSLRYRFTPWLFAKTSYEYATRLPRPDEVYGNGSLVHENRKLRPEISHNANLGPRFELQRTRIGELTVDVNAFLRETDRLIVMLGNRLFYTYQNVNKARGLGIEGALNWVSPGRYVSLDGMMTWQEVRNASSKGSFGNYDGDRIPNRPYLFASWGARLRFAHMPHARDTLEPFYSGRYVHSFYRGWESAGASEYKQTVASQVTQSVGITWTVQRDPGRLTATFEVDNVADAAVYDNFGVQRPGRALYVKLTVEI